MPRGGAEKTYSCADVGTVMPKLTITAIGPVSQIRTSDLKCIAVLSSAGLVGPPPSNFYYFIGSLDVVTRTSMRVFDLPSPIVCVDAGKLLFLP